MRDRRFEPRDSSAEKVDLHWQEPDGTAAVQAGELRDHSASGAKILLDRPVRLQTLVRFTSGGQDHSGKVRFCTRDRTGYLLGIEFDSA